jgi:uncharacterized protein (TIGR03382 family)
MNHTIAHRHFLAAAAVATTLAFSSAPARAATLVVDNVENVSTTWTFTGLSTFPTWTPSGTFGLAAQAGSEYFRISTSSTGAVSGTVRRTEGFGPTFLVAAGTYTLSMYAGEGDITVSRRSFTTLEAVLATTGGTEFVDKTVVTPYVDPASITTADWTLTTVQYEIPIGSPLIGQEFTWGFNWAKTSGSGFMGAWDAASVDFVAIPEPGAAALGSLGLLALLRRRR